MHLKINAVPQKLPIAKNLLLTMAKRPMPGQTKTRLSPPLSAVAAAELYTAFLKDTLDLMRRVPNVQPAIAYTPETERSYFAGLAPDFELIPQVGTTLGERLANVSAHLFAEGYEKVVMMDSDSPTLPLDYITAACDALNGPADVSLGPCDDGGYYLIGLRRPAPRLFLEVQMSTPNVVSDTLAIARDEHLTVTMLEPWYDVDNASALAQLQQELVILSPNLATHTRACFQHFPEMS